MRASDIGRWRLHNLLLRDSPARSPGEVVDHLAASQGQDFLPGLWSLGQRSGTTYDVGCAAFDRGDVLRTHVLRPTWHLVGSADVRWLLAATAPRVHKLNAYYYRQLGVDDEATSAARRVLERELPGRHLTRAELGERLSAGGNRLAYLLMWAELEGILVSGARSGNQQTYALLDERAPGVMPSREEALAELGRRYFATRGPATVKDLAGWASLTVGEARQACASLDGFEEVPVDGRTYLVTGELPPAGEPRVDLVQAYDECIMSYSESKDVLVSGSRWTEQAPASYMHAILVDGQLVGHWRYDRDARGRAGAPQTFTYRELSAEEKDALALASDAFVAFAG